MEFSIQLAIFLITLMFIISGFDKTITLGASEALRLSNKIGINVDISTLIVLAAGIYELVASGMLLYGTFTKNVNLVYIATYSLIIFTFLATAIFYMFPFKFKPFLSNISVMAGLYLLLNICVFKSDKLF
jgi:uncharacterized membrane protein YphA (DoxX/SURF4 family)